MLDQRQTPEQESVVGVRCQAAAFLELRVPPDEEEEVVARPMAVGGLTLPTLEPPPPRSSSPSPTAELMRGAGTTPILSHMPEPGFGDLEPSEDTWRSEPFPPPPPAATGGAPHATTAAPAGWMGFDQGRPQELASVPRPTMAQPAMQQPAMMQQPVMPQQPAMAQPPAMVQMPQLAMAQPAMAKPPPPPAKPASALDDLNFAIQQAMGGAPSPAHSGAVPTGGARIALRSPLGWHGSLGSVLLLGWRLLC